MHYWRHNERHRTYSVFYCKTISILSGKSLRKAVLEILKIFHKCHLAALSHKRGERHFIERTGDYLIFVEFPNIGLNDLFMKKNSIFLRKKESTFCKLLSLFSNGRDVGPAVNLKLESATYDQHSASRKLADEQMLVSQPIGFFLK